MIAGILALLQTQRSGVQLDGKMILATFPLWGVAAAFIGSVYPLADHYIYGKIHEFKQDWSNAIRSVAILVGIHQASTVSLLLQSCIIVCLYAGAVACLTMFQFKMFNCKTKVCSCYPRCW